MYTQHIWEVNKNNWQRVTTRVVIQDVRYGHPKIPPFFDKGYNCRWVLDGE